ncbi:MAG TPA: MerR family transcriptional regulator [Cyclobacteriaceae bacterium]|nr:MerR family transcriptional regulator [Cyclobacteriaceae bacterium]
MLIGELSKRTGFSHDTIRFYEKKGLIKVDRKARRENNYKEYPEAVYEQLVLIKTVKDLGFTLNEVDDFVKAWSEANASCTNLSHYLTEKINYVDQQINVLLGIKSKLNDSLQRCKNDNCEFEKLVPSCIKC